MEKVWKNCISENAGPFNYTDKPGNESFIRRRNEKPSGNSGVATGCKTHKFDL